MAHLFNKLLFYKHVALCFHLLPIISCDQGSCVNAQVPWALLITLSCSLYIVYVCKAFVLIEYLRVIGGGVCDQIGSKVTGWYCTVAFVANLSRCLLLFYLICLGPLAFHNLMRLFKFVC